MTWDGPDDDLANDLAVVVLEIRMALDTNRFAISNSLRMYPPALSLAALAHCCALLEGMQATRSPEHELIHRLHARGHMEAWFTAAWLYLGGDEAARVLIGDYKRSVRTQNEAIALPGLPQVRLTPYV